MDGITPERGFWVKGRNFTDPVERKARRMADVSKDKTRCAYCDKIIYGGVYYTTNDSPCHRDHVVLMEGKEFHGGRRKRER